MGKTRKVLYYDSRKGNDLKRVTVDTTVMEKNIAHPTDARLYETARRKLVGLAREVGIGLWQNYNRLAPRLARQVDRYARARQFKRMRNGRMKPLFSMGCETQASPLSLSEWLM